MKITRAITIFLLIASLLCLFAGCNGEEPIVTDPAPGGTEEPATELLVLVDNGKSDFTLIRSEEASGYYLDTAKAVNVKIKNTLCDKIKLADDWTGPLNPVPADAHEILLFETKRAESIQAMADLDIEGYLIRVTDCKVVIVGSSPAACNEALYYFFDTLIPEHTSGGRIALPIGFEKKQEFKSSDFDIAKALREGKTVCADFKLVFHYPGIEGFRVSQGSATDGKYAYVAMKDGSGAAEVDKIVKIDMATWDVVAVSETFPLDHANDITYDPVKKQLIVVNMLSNTVSLIDAETLAFIDATALTFGTWGAGYVDGASQYAFLAHGTPSGLVITDTDFKPIRSSPLADSTGYVGQGMDADSKYAYVPLSPSSGKNDNIIQIYDITTGEYLGIVSVATKMESESMFHANGKQYMHFNSQGSQIAELEYYIRFE
ncbi:MAG: hypothetical protein J6S71_08060 [Clostridia bacterium]|nr:hypothetical protein [Clostridia bacterium]